MTTSSQQTVLTEEELACLRAVAEGRVQPADDESVGPLIAKGMLAGDEASGRRALTPAGQHAVDVGGPGMVPGIDE